jgi:hypothetical protein
MKSIAMPDQFDADTGWWCVGLLDDLLTASKERFPGAPFLTGIEVAAGTLTAALTHRVPPKAPARPGLTVIPGGR